MGKGAWKAKSLGPQRVRHSLATKQQQQPGGKVSSGSSYAAIFATFSLSFLYSMNIQQRTDIIFLSAGKY